MATLTVNGTKITVDDAFLSLPKAQQEATVNEIAAQLGVKAAPSAVASAPGGQGALPDQQQQAAAPSPNLLDSTMATINGLTSSVPFLQQASDALIAGGQTAWDAATGQPVDFGARYGANRKVHEDAASKAPLANLAGQFGGLLMGTGAIGATRAGAEALGLTGPLMQRIGNSALSSAGLAGLDSYSQGNDGATVLGDMGLGGAVGAAIPGLGALARVGSKAINSGIVRPIATAFNRDNEAIARTGRAMQQDLNTGSFMTQADEATAQAAGVPVMNADRYGQATRTLARTAANVSPEADATLRRAVEDRFHTQGNRAVSFVQKLMKGATDDLGLHQQLRAAADASNKVRYGAAYSSPEARAIWNNPIKELMQSDRFRQAISLAESRGTDKAAISGGIAVRNPFVFGQNGSVSLRKKPDGSTALPSLQFWDQVKRNLDSMIDAAKPTIAGGGDRALYADLTAMKAKLVGALDHAVPAYKQARQGAAAFFGADDAIEAGRKAATSPKEIPEIARAVKSMSPAERDAFSVGFSSEIIDTIKASRDRVNVINQVFGSQSSRERIELALGPQKARELEAYARVESIVDQLRGAVTGNSTTAKQLIASGVLGGAGGYFSSGGNVQTALTWGAVASLGRRGLQVLGKRVDDEVMTRVAKMLVSTNPADMQRVIQNASLSQKQMQALEAIMRGMQITSFAGAQTALH